MNIFEIINQSKQSFPVNIENTFANVGITFKSEPLNEDVFGCLKKTGEDKFEVTVNSNNSINRQRFTAAHELGHFVLHRHLLGNGISDNTAYRSIAGSECYNSNITARHETEANMFAAAFLMPKELVTAEWNLGDTNTQSLAFKFQVSAAAMEIRLKSLGFKR